MKQVFSIFLALLIFLQLLSKMYIYISFKINQDLIAKTLCVKKEIKNNTCQGKCHLKKELAKADEQEKKQAPTNQKDNSEVIYYHTHKSYDLLKHPFIYLSKVNSGYGYNFHTSSFITDFFRPPKLSSI